ncbi:MAG: hypothetical protein LDLANPLL_02211 [Turneriella sp.]|nr:hypothetical protein [Turneriella sp.]
MGTVQLSARSWDDLDQNESRAYRREREEKYPLRLFFVEREAWENHRAWHVLFLWGQKDYPRYESTWVFPFFKSLKSKMDKRSYFLTPLSYKEEDITSWDFSLFWLYYSGADENPRSHYHALAPFYYYSIEEKKSYSILTPLFWYHAHLDDQEYSSLVTPVSFTLSRKGENYTSLLWLVYWGKSDAEKYFYHAVFPLYFALHDTRGLQFYSPLYWKSDTADSSFQMLLPIYLSYRRPGYALHINALGFSFAEENASALPVGVSVKDKTLFVDTDFGWFYNLLRLSWRESIHLDTDEKNAAATSATLPQTPQLSQMRKRDRAHSENFRGVYLLFGLFAYEHADTYRHIRLLPLSWLTWDKNSDTGVKAFLPFYFNYKDANIEYKIIAALLPLYGKQQQFFPECTSSTEAWLAIVYWSEYDCKKNWSEKTVLWPLVNTYNAPNEGGYRIFPVFWYKWRMNNNKHAYRHFSPLHLTTGSENFTDTYTWLFYRTRSEQKSTWGVWALLHFSHNANQTLMEDTTYVLPFYYTTTTYLPSESNPRGSSSSLFSFAALFWRYAEIRDATKNFTLHISPLYFYAQENQRSYFFSWVYYDFQKNTSRSVGVPLLFHRYTEESNQYKNFYIFPLYQSWQQSAAGETYTTWFFPLYYYEGAPQSVEFQAVFGLLGGFKKNAQVLRWHAALLVGYKYIKDAYTDHYVLPLWYHSRYRSEVSTSFETYIPILLSKFSNDDNGARVQRILVLGLLYYYNSEREKFYQREHLLLGTLYYHNKKYERAADGHPRHFDSYGSLWGLLWHYETEENYKRFSILTFVYTRTERDGNVRHRVMGVSF